MSITVVTAVLPEYIRFELSGDYSLAELFEFIDQAKSEADSVGRDHLLINTLGLEGSMSEADRFMAGRQIADVFGPRLKAGCIMPAEGITKLGELTADNRGARFFVTGTEDEALRWLLTS